MNRSLFDWRDLTIYGLTGLGAIIFAFWISSQFSGRAFSQTNPPGGAPQTIMPPLPPPPAPQAPQVAPQNQTYPTGGAAQFQPPPSTPVPDQAVKSTDSQILTFPGSPTAPATTENKIPDLLTGIIEDYTYNPAGKRDPFTPIEKSNGSAMAGPIWPLQRYDLEQLKLVGIIWEVKTPKAMIMDPSGHGYVVTVNERIGRNNGYIARIREGEIVVVENIIGSDGKSAYVTKLMKLHPQ